MPILWCAKESNDLLKAGAKVGLDAHADSCNSLASKETVRSEQVCGEFGAEECSSGF